MAIVLLGTQTASFKTRERLDYGPFIHREGRAFMYYLQMITPSAEVEGGYFNVNASFADSGENIRSPLITKFFPTETKQAFLVKIPRIRDSNNQSVLLQVTPKEFYRGTVGTPEIDVSLFREDKEQYGLTDSFP